MVSNRPWGSTGSDQDGVRLFTDAWFGQTLVLLRARWAVGSTSWKELILLVTCLICLNLVTVSVQRITLLFDRWVGKIIRFIFIVFGIHLHYNVSTSSRYTRSTLFLRRSLVECLRRVIIVMRIGSGGLTTRDRLSIIIHAFIHRSKINLISVTRVSFILTQIEGLRKSICHEVIHHPKLWRSTLSRIFLLWGVSCQRRVTIRVWRVRNRRVSYVLGLWVCMTRLHHHLVQLCSFAPQRTRFVIHISLQRILLLLEPLILVDIILVNLSVP